MKLPTFVACLIGFLIALAHVMLKKAKKRENQTWTIIEVLKMADFKFVICLCFFFACMRDKFVNYVVARARLSWILG